MVIFKIGRKRRRHLADRKLHSHGNRFGGLVELFDIIVMQIEEIPDLFEGRRRQCGHHRLAIFAHSRGQRRALFNGLTIFPKLCKSPQFCSQNFAISAIFNRFGCGYCEVWVEWQAVRSVEMVAVNDRGRPVAISQTANSREADKEVVS